MNKKAFFFTTIAIALSIVIILSHNVYTGYRLKDKMESTEVRIDTMNNFIKDLENDIQNAIFIVGFRSLLSLEDYIMEYGKFFSEPDMPSLGNAFEEVFGYGTIDSEKMSLMENNTFLNWAEKMKAQADKIDVVLDVAINDVTITQTEPWMVDVSVNLRINAQDKKNTASWTINKVFTKKINITGFVDPLYLINTNGIANNTIRKTTVLNFPSGLPTHLSNAYYIEHSDAPSYLMRFENKLASSPYGIESLVTQRLKGKGLPVSSKSAVDFIYFDPSSTTADCNVLEIADTDFFLDYNPSPSHLNFYQATCTP